MVEGLVEWVAGNDGMRLLIKSTNFSLTPALRQFIDDKIGSEVAEFIEKTFGISEAPRGQRDTVQVRVEVGRTTRHHRKGNVFRAEATIALPGKKSLRAEATESDVRVAVDRVRDELHIEMKRWKEKRNERFKKGARLLKARAKNI